MASPLLTRSGPAGDQILVDGAIADAVLAFDGKSLLYVTRPDGQPTIPRSNLGGLALARWNIHASSRSLAKKLVETIVRRSRELELFVDRSRESEQLLDMTVLATTLAMNYLQRGKFDEK